MVVLLLAGVSLVSVDPQRVLLLVVVAVTVTIGGDASVFVVAARSGAPHTRLCVLDRLCPNRGRDIEQQPDSREDELPCFNCHKDVEGDVAEVTQP